MAAGARQYKGLAAHARMICAARRHAPTMLMEVSAEVKPLVLT